MMQHSATWTVPLSDAAATERLAGRIARFLAAGDCLALSGEIGTGKTTLARALIRFVAQDAALDVPSPSFSLVQSYDLPRLCITHADLYRLEDASEDEELGLADAVDNGLLILEWPDRLGGRLPDDRLDVRLELAVRDGHEERIAHLAAHGSVIPRFGDWKTIAAFLLHAGFDDAERLHLQGDAGARRYERLIGARGSAILMIAPPRTDTKPVRTGRSYLQIAHLSETVHAFSAIAKALRAQGFRAPYIFAEDLDQGLLITEDLGDVLIVDDAGPVAGRYIATAELLADLHAQDWPAETPVDETRSHKLLPYDLEAYLIEAELMLDWYIPVTRRNSFTGAARARFVAAWTETLAMVLRGEKTWTLRDVHSPNVLWQAEAEGRDRIGLIDIQDTLIGHPAYDLASLAQDARVDVPVALEVKILAAYCRRRGFDERARNAFLRAYVILAAQRATKLLGIFARLDERDGKPQYRRHLPRIERNLTRNLAHPALAPVERWMRDALPGFFEAKKG
jgi:N-acetylmuramate 1-kinase